MESLFYFANPNEKTVVSGKGVKLQTDNLTEALNNVAEGQFIFAESPFEGRNLTYSVAETGYSPPQISSLKTREPQRFELSPDRKQWDQIFRLAQSRLGEDLNKLVLARKTVFDFRESLDPVLFAFQLLSQGLNTYKILKRDDVGSVFFSKTPEKLLKWSNGVLETDAIAGTQAKGTNQEDLANSSKDQIEHQIVVERIMECLKPYATKVDVLEQDILAQNSIIHLRTPLRAEGVRFEDLEEIALKLHPTAAVAGDPKELSREWLLENEPFVRGSYAGLFGIFSRDYVELAVCIRSGFIEPQKLELFTGTGIVKASESELEWHEHNLKLESVLAGCVNAEELN